MESFGTETVSALAFAKTQLCRPISGKNISFFSPVILYLHYFYDFLNIVGSSGKYQSMHDIRKRCEDKGCTSSAQNLYESTKSGKVAYPYLSDDF